MGNQLSNVQPTAINTITDIPLYLLTHAPQYTVVTTISANKHIRTLHCTDTVTGQSVVVKVYVCKTAPTDGQYELEQSLLNTYNTQCDKLSSTIHQYNTAAHTHHHHCHTLPTVRYTDINASATQRAHIYIRQYIAHNLSDRLTQSQPPLSYTHKLCTAYQLLRAVRQLHAMNVVHGDITPQNILLTSYDYVYLSDISNYKPTHINAEHPAEYATRSKHSNRRNVCYAAPERFNGGCDALTTEMDVFSVGCVLAELFANTPIFDYVSLLAYRDGKHNLDGVLNKIDSAGIRSMIRSMLELTPNKRHDIQYYIDTYADSLFQQHDQLYTVLESIAVCTSVDNKIDCVQTNLSQIEQLALHQPDMVQPIILLLCTSLRHTVLPQSRVTALQLLRALSTHLSDAQKLAICTPYIMAVITDNSPATLRGTALHTLADILYKVHSTPYNQRLLVSNYVLPGLSNLLNDTSTVICIAYAQCLHMLAGAAFHSLHCTIKYNDDYNTGHTAIQNQVLQLLLHVLTHTSKAVRRAVLPHMSEICTLIGVELTCNNVLPHTITIMNEHSEWQLRYDLCDVISGLAVLVGQHAFTSYLLPCIEQLNFDPIESIIVKSLYTFQQCVQVGLCDKNKLLQWLQRHSVLCIHPRQSVRTAAMECVYTVSQQFSDVECIVQVVPLLYSVLHDKSIVDLHPDIVTPALRSPLTMEQLLDIDEVGAQLQLDLKLVSALRQYMAQCRATKQYLSTGDTQAQKYGQVIEKLQVHSKAAQASKVNTMSKKVH